MAYFKATHLFVGSVLGLKSFSVVFRGIPPLLVFPFFYDPYWNNRALVKKTKFCWLTLCSSLIFPWKQNLIRQVNSSTFRRCLPKSDLHGSQYCCRNGFSLLFSNIAFA
jgi:hypothetical protein